MNVVCSLNALTCCCSASAACSAGAWADGTSAASCEVLIAAGPTAGCKPFWPPAGCRPFWPAATPLSKPSAQGSTAMAISAASVRVAACHSACPKCKHQQCKQGTTRKGACRPTPVQQSHSCAVKVTLASQPSQLPHLYGDPLRPDLDWCGQRSPRCGGHWTQPPHLTRPQWDGGECSHPGAAEGHEGAGRSDGWAPVPRCAACRCTARPYGCWPAKGEGHPIDKDGDCMPGFTTLGQAQPGCGLS